MKHSEFFKSIIPATLDHFRGKDVTHVQLFCLGVLHRMLKASLMLEHCINNVQDFEYLEFSAGLTARAVILDILIGMNLYKNIKDLTDQEKTDKEILEVAEDFCKLILADGLDMSVKYFNAIKKAGFKSDEEVKHAMNQLANDYNEYLLSPHNNDGSSPKFMVHKNNRPFHWFDNLAQDPQMNRLSAIYDKYFYYSKYDHLGILYFTLNDISIDQRIEMLQRTVNLFLWPCTMIYEMLERASGNDKVVLQFFGMASEYFSVINNVQ